MCGVKTYVFSVVIINFLRQGFDITIFTMCLQNRDAHIQEN